MTQFDPSQLPPVGGAPAAGMIEAESAHDGLDRIENAIELKEFEGLSQGRIVWRRFLRHRGAMIAAGVLAALLIIAYSSVGITVLGINVPGWWKHGYTDLNPIQNHLRPTLRLWPPHLGNHPFGQDEIGRDVFAETMRGIQQSIMIIFVIGVVSTAIGVVVGSLAGYFGGWVDAVLMRVTDGFIIVPVLITAAIVAHFAAGAGAFALALFLGLLLWTTLARLVRGEVLTLRTREFVDAAKVAGASHRRVIFKHILPNAAGVIVVSMTLTMAAAILLEAALGYLGLGVQPPDISLGSLMNLYQSSFDTRPWLFWYTGTFILVIALTVNFIGDGLRDAFDPRQRRIPGRNAAAAPTAPMQEPPTPIGKGE